MKPIRSAFSSNPGLLQNLESSRTEATTQSLQKCDDKYITVSSNFILEDQTMNFNQPQSYGITIKPLVRKLDHSELPLSILGNETVPRCRNAACTAYLNPYVQIFDHTKMWKCNFCATDNPLQDKYEKKGHPELTNYSYEFQSSQMYIKV